MHRAPGIYTELSDSSTLFLIVVRLFNNYEAESLLDPGNGCLAGMIGTLANKSVPVKTLPGSMLTDTVGLSTRWHSCGGDLTNLKQLLDSNRDFG